MRLHRRFLETDRLVVEKVSNRPKRAYYDSVARAYESDVVDKVIKARDDAWDIVMATPAGTRAGTLAKLDMLIEWFSPGEGYDWDDTLLDALRSIRRDVDEAALAAA